MEFENLPLQNGVILAGNKSTSEKIESNKDDGQHGKKKLRVKRGKFRRYTPHVLIGIIVYVTLRVVFSNVDMWPTPMQWHVIWGVVGYQVLLGHGTLIIHTVAHKGVFFFPNTSKKTLHWVVTALGAACAALGLYYIYSDKENHFNSVHGVLGLISIILTAMSLLNGVVFYYWQELGLGKRNIKFLHTLTGLLAFVASTACLMYGYNKKTFLRWSSGLIAYGLMLVCGVSISFFILTPGRIILNRFATINPDEKDKKDKEAVQKGDESKIQEKDHKIE